jgi:hypothetical protein
VSGRANGVRLLSALGVMLGACAPSPPPDTAARAAAQDYPGELADSTALPDGLFLRQRIEARFGGRELGFAAVLQSEAGVLSLLALTPYGTRAFLLTQRGQALSFTRYVDQALPFPPRFIMLDVHRTLFLGLPGAPLADGEHQGLRGGERIRERWQGGRLLARSFERVDGRPRGLIRVAYRGGMLGAMPPARIDLDNGWFAYQLAIHTLED